MSKGYIYILTNPSFPEWVKIGYADDVEDRVVQLNRTECTPFAFRIYATYEVSDRLKDIPVHTLIDQLNPELRSRDEVDGKQRVREFYAMTPEAAYSILESVAKINGLEQNLKLWKKSKEALVDEKTAEQIKTLTNNRHYFKDLDFHSSLTNKEYHGTTNSDGTLCIIDKESNTEIPNNSNPSKKSIVRRAVEDLGENTEKDETLYQLYHRLMKLLK